MITRRELAEYAKITGLNLGQAEKDYFQNILLFIIYQSYGTGVIFKGGTALKKCYGLNRFSEDLDFTCVAEFDAEEMKKGMERFKIESEMKTNEHENGLKIMLKIRGPLYAGVPQSLCNFVVDLSFRENVILPPAVKTIGRFMEEVPSFDVLVMQEKEILAEKIRAILSRHKSRDLFDLWFLIKKGVKADEGILEEKFRYYRRSWDIGEFESRVGAIKTIWDSELRPLVKNVPNFDEVTDVVLEEVKKWAFRKTPE